MAGVLLETLSWWKLAAFAALILILQLISFLIGGLIGLDIFVLLNVLLICLLVVLVNRFRFNSLFEF